MVSPLQVPNAAEQRVGRRPQTTEEPVVGGPFLRFTRESRVQAYTSSGNGFSGLVNQPLKAVPGYLKYLDVSVVASGGAGGSAVAAADAPYSAVQQVLLKDAFGQPIVQGGGYSVLRLLALYSGQHGFWNASDPANLPSFSAVDANGNFTVRSRIPLELFDGFCALPAANASAVPSLQVNLNATGQIYSTPPAGAQPTFAVGVQEAFYQVPLEDPNMAPPDVGSSCQWTEQQIAGQLSGTAQAATLQLPSQGGFLTTLIFVFRDANGVRTDNILPANTSTIELWVDGAPLYVEEVGSRIDLMFQMFGVTRPAGVLVYTFRNAVGNFGPVSAIDTGDLFLPTTPGTLIELRSAAFGRTAYTGPASVTVLSGRVFPASGIPYTHLAD